MIAMPTPHVPEKYSEYKNRTFTKHENKISNMLTQIKECSLRREDKIKLVNKLSEQLTESIR